MESENEKLYQRFQNQILREDSLVNYRLTWFLIFQGLLFSSISSSGNCEFYRESVSSLVAGAIPFLGFFSALWALIAIGLGKIAYITLHKQWTLKKLDIEPNPFGIQQGDCGYFWLCVGPATAIPFAILVIWLAALLGEI